MYNANVLRSLCLPRANDLGIATFYVYLRGTFTYAMQLSSVRNKKKYKYFYHQD